jgi:site-specific recombinase XerD
VIDYVSLVRPALCSRHPDSAVALFLSQRGRRLGVRALADALKKLGRQAGLRKTVKPHMLRRTFASTLLKAGVSVRHIQLLLGHADLNTTALYLRLDTRELRRELLLKHPRETFDA